jgi:hypothetical protein
LTTFPVYHIGKLTGNQFAGHRRRKQILQASNFEGYLDEMAALSQSLNGCLSVREARFLALAAAMMPPSLAELVAHDAVDANKWQAIIEKICLRLKPARSKQKSATDTIRYDEQKNY